MLNADLNTISNVLPKFVLVFLASPKQFAYIVKRFTEEDGMLTPNLLQDLKSNGIGVYMVTMDFERTFDWSNQDLLTVVSESSGLQDQLKNWIKNN